MDFLTLKDLAIITGLIGTWATWYISNKKKAADEAVRQNNVKRDIEDIRKEITRLHSEDESAESFRSDVYKFIEEFNVWKATLEQRLKHANVNGER